MGRVFKLVLSCVMCAICLSLLAFGVYAAVKVEYQLTNTVSYELEDVYCTIDGTVTGAYSDSDGTSKTSGTSFSWTNIKSDGSVEVNKANPVWDLDQLYFYNENPDQDIVISISIKNEMNVPINIVPTFTPTDSTMYYITNGAANASAVIQATLGYKVNSTATSETTISVAGGSTLNATLTLSLYNEFDSFSGAEFNWKFIIKI